jgi:hypothetical protein
VGSGIIDGMSSSPPERTAHVPQDARPIAGWASQHAAAPAFDGHLADACDGWRLRRRCVDAGGRQLRDPHPQCLEAQHRYVLALLEHRLSPPPD